MSHLSSEQEQAIRLIREIKYLQQERENLLWHEGEIWYKLKEEKLFRHAGGLQKISWKSFLAEMGVPLATVEYKIALYKKWINELGYSLDDLKGIHTRKLHRAIPYVNSKEKAEEVLKQARALPLNDFFDWLKTDL